MAKIISLSVWGSKPQYSVGAIKNIELAEKIFPDWKCRLFVDGTVPTHYVEKFLTYSNVEIAQVDNKESYGMFWRFYSMFQSEDDISISRDSDSRLSEREKKIIDEWIDSDKKLSIIRDHNRHYDWPIMGGMWGFKGKLSDDILETMHVYEKTHTYAYDQAFLRDAVWPRYENDCIINGFHENEWMKETRSETNFIGQGYDENDNPIYDGVEGHKIVGE